MSRASWRRPTRRDMQVMVVLETLVFATPWVVPLYVLLAKSQLTVLLIN